MARSRPGDDRGQEPGEDRGALRRPSDDGLPLASSVSARAGCQQAAKLKRDRRSGRDLRPRILQGPMVRSAAPCAQTRRQGQASGALSGQYSRSSFALGDRKGAPTFDAVLPSGRRGFHRKSACQRGHTGQPSDRRRRPANRRLRPQSRNSIPTRCSRQESQLPQAPHLHINNVNAATRGRLKQWLNRFFNGVATKNLAKLSPDGDALEAWGDKLEPPNWIKGAIGNGPSPQHLNVIFSELAFGQTGESAISCRIPQIRVMATLETSEPRKKKQLLGREN